MLTVQSSLVFRHGAAAQALVLARVERLIGHPRLDLAPTNCALDQADWDCFQPLRLPSTKRAFFGVFPMFVPSLSWSNVRLYI
jgi:hypothetical protein